MSSEPSSQPSAVSVRQLSASDAEVLEAILEARARGGDTGPVPAGGQERAEKLRALLALLDELAPETDEQSETGVARTLESVRSARQRERFATQVQMLAGSTGGTGASWRQVAASAAIFLLAISLLFPFLERNRTESQRLTCAANLGSVGAGFEGYARDHNGLLPRRAIQPGSVWWNVGEPSRDGVVRSNSAHLFLLIQQGYVTPEDLACPANPDAQTDGLAAAEDWASPQAVSYSYQNQYTPEAIRLDANPHLALLADKNPLFVVRQGRVTFDTEAAPAAPSRVHGGRGQNVLLPGRQVIWIARPLIDMPSGERDNIWLLRGRDHYNGTEHPDSPDDSFLVP